jgi:hypothetical protein
MGKTDDPGGYATAQVQRQITPGTGTQQACKNDVTFFRS